MKRLLSLIAGLFQFNSVIAVEPFKNVETIVDYIRSFEGNANDLKVPISDEVNDQIGLNMAIITDAILAKGFEPNGFEQKKGYRVYVYKDLE